VSEASRRLTKPVCCNAKLASPWKEDLGELVYHKGGVVLIFDGELSNAVPLVEVEEDFPFAIGEEELSGRPVPRGRGGKAGADLWLLESRLVRSKYRNGTRQLVGSRGPGKVARERELLGHAAQELRTVGTAAAMQRELGDGEQPTT
jgi:hypothetical protein